MDIVPFILWNHLVKNCQTFENLAVLPRILWYAWQAIPPSPRGHFRSTCYIELTPTDVRGDQVMGSIYIFLYTVKLWYHKHQSSYQTPLISQNDFIKNQKKTQYIHIKHRNQEYPTNIEVDSQS